ncbi:MAG: hypothetical protein RMJ98_00265 [Myxococcales bacterium]|nr:hypothetical protein [Polyangiaceae bacterium]MDW8247720.1 hypothetical protein [Myxococcales bacterium]
MTTSRISGFSRYSLRERLEELTRAGELDEETTAFFHRGGGLDVTVADRMSENVVATHGLPLAVARRAICDSSSADSCLRRVHDRAADSPRQWGYVRCHCGTV